MLDGYAEPHAMHARQVCHIAVYTLHNESRTIACCLRLQCVDIGELAFGITAIFPAQLAEVNGITYAKIMERAEHAALDGLRQTQLRGRMTAEVLQDILAIHALRCRGKSQ